MLTDINKHRKVAFYTLGCKVNQYETNAMTQQFKNNDYEIVDFSERADIYVINTCTVTNMSDKKSRQILRRAKEKNQDSIVIAVGCYVQVAKEEIEKIPEIDLAVGTNDKANIITYVQDFYNNRQIDTKVYDIVNEAEYEEFGSITYTEKTRAVIKIQDGCDRFCSYCIIPYARGKVRSRQPESILNEIREIKEKGLKEVVLTGIHIASYGKDFGTEYRLINLLEDINKIEGIERIRLGSIEPILMSENFIIRIKVLEKVCHHFHLSLQSGCTDTLKRMNRKYTTDEFRKIVDNIRKEFSDAILTTDIIVGFPGETDKEFEETYEFLKKINFYKMHIFKYSQRKGTKAAMMKEQVLEEIKDERSKRLLLLSDENEQKYQKSYLGQKVKVLFEEFDGRYYKGHTSNYIVVKTTYNESITGEIVDVILEKTDKFEIIGSVV